ncbi:MAG: hypothetical protein AAGF19_00815 [Pseudomonadota bacterium]
MSVADLFHLFVACHIVTGSVGLVAFWVPVGGRKGGPTHGRFGMLFIQTMLATGGFAVLISLCTLADPIGTHPHLLHHELFGSAQSIRAIFGWMMLYLAILTVNLAWYGYQCIRNKRAYKKNREWRNVALQGLLGVAALNCLVQGALAGQVLMIGISFVGFATVATNLYFLYKPKPGPKEWLLEHIKGLVGAGISVYTAFFAFGAVRLLPEAALTPALWSAPLIVGVSLIIYHRRRIERGTFRPFRRTPKTA